MDCNVLGLPVISRGTGILEILDTGLSHISPIPWHDHRRVVP